jgi:hypothetical protein
MGSIESYSIQVFRDHIYMSFIKRSCLGDFVCHSRVVVDIVHDYDESPLLDNLQIRLQTSL